MYIVPTFIEAQKQSAVYNYYSENKIGEVFQNILKEIADRMMLQESEKSMAESILYFYLS